MREEVIAAGSTDGPALTTELTGGPLPAGTRVQYQKHMAHHLLPTLPRDWISRLVNVLLIREPDEVAASYLRSRATVTAADLGFVQQVQLFDSLAAAGAPPPVIDAADFLRDPPTYLRWLCGLVGVDFTERMLHWPAGSRSSDGVWAPHWYAAVRASTSFEPYRPRPLRLEGAAMRAATANRPAYARLHALRQRL